MEIFATHLPRDVQDGEIRALFEEHGAVEKFSLVRDKTTGESRGFAFVVMPNDDEARSAIAAVDRLAWRGKTLVARVSSKEKPRNRGYIRQGSES